MNQFFIVLSVQRETAFGDGTQATDAIDRHKVKRHWRIPLIYPQCHSAR